MHGFICILRLALNSILLISCAILVFSTTVNGWTHRLKEEVVTPRGWIRLGQPPQSHMIHLRIGLPQLKFDQLEKQLFEVSDPHHHNYGKHLSKEEVEALVAPHQNSIDIVDDWLESVGIPGNHLARSPAGDWVMINISISLAEEMLNTVSAWLQCSVQRRTQVTYVQKYYVWQHVSSGDRLVRTTRYCLPVHLHKHIDVIQPTTIFSRFKAQKSMIVLPSPDAEIVEPNAETKKQFGAAGASVDATCNRTITISCLQQLYNAVGYTPSSDIGNSIGIASYLVFLSVVGKDCNSKFLY
jgi:tripeptidyl-peptidase-1